MLIITNICYHNTDVDDDNGGLLTAILLLIIVSQTITVVGDKCGWRIVRTLLHVVMVGMEVSNYDN